MLYRSSEAYYTSNCKTYYSDQTPPFEKTPPLTCAEGSFAVAPFLIFNRAFNLFEVVTCLTCQEPCKIRHVRTFLFTCPKIIQLLVHLTSQQQIIIMSGKHRTNYYRDLLNYNSVLKYMGGSE